jgi:hypothetical protein
VSSARRLPLADSAPAPLVREIEGEAAWDEWSRAVQQQDAGFAPTAPASLEAAGGKSQAFAPTQPTPLQAAAAAPPPPKPRAELTLEQVVHEARRNNRVCPKPAKWQSMYALLAASATTAPLPPPPLTGAVWEHTPAMPKRMCFIEHIEWAAAHGCLPAVHAFIKALGENDWHYASS